VLWRPWKAKLVLVLIKRASLYLELVLPPSELLVQINFEKFGDLKTGKINGKALW
jgi:hypothetical protein